MYKAIKVAIIACIITSVAVIGFTEGSNHKKSNPLSSHYSIKCYKCKKQAETNHACYGCVATRRFDECNKEIDGELYMVYKCQHGHTLYVNLCDHNDKR